MVHQMRCCQHRRRAACRRARQKRRARGRDLLGASPAQPTALADNPACETLGQRCMAAVRSPFRPPQSKIEQAYFEKYGVERLSIVSAPVMASWLYDEHDACVIDAGYSVSVPLFAEIAGVDLVGGGRDVLTRITDPVHRVLGRQRRGAATLRKVRRGRQGGAPQHPHNIPALVPVFARRQLHRRGLRVWRLFNELHSTDSLHLVPRHRLRSLDGGSRSLSGWCLSRAGATSL